MTRGALLLLAVAIATAPAEAATHRSPATVRAFMKIHPCPGGPDAGSTRRCRGFVADHVIALKCGGPDIPDNLQWMAIEDGKAKDRWERIGC